MCVWFPRDALGFVRAFVLTAVALAVSVPLLNMIVDPYWNFGLVEWGGFNTVKPQFANELRLGKARSVCRVKPEAVIMGSSRAEMSLDPSHPGFASLSSRTYNLGMPGIGIYEVYRNLQHAYFASGASLKLAVIALDELMFAANRELVVFGTEVLGYDEMRLALGPEQNCISTMKVDADVLLFGRGLRSSMFTIANQDFDELYLANGMRNQERNRLVLGMPLTGHRGAFRGNEAYYLKRVWTAGPARRFCLNRPGYGSTLDTLRKIVDFAREHDIELKFVLPPQHARMLITLREAGMWPAMEEIKRGVVRVLADDASRHPGAKPFPLWDFYNFNSLTTEPVPPAGDLKTQMQWHWETSHYKLATGNRVLDRVLGYKDPARLVPGDFGVLLTAANVEVELVRLLADSRDYERRFPEDVIEIRKIADEALSGTQGVLCMPSFETFEQGLDALDRKDRSVADSFFDQALQLEAAERADFVKRGLPYREALESQIRGVRRAGIAIRPLATPLAYQERANQRRAASDFEGAVADFTEAIQRGPENTALYYMRAVTRSEMADYAGALADFDAVLKLDPRNATVPPLRAQALADMEQGKKRP